MLTDERQKILPVHAFVIWDWTRQVHKAKCNDVLYLVEQLADALLARQRDRDRCKRAGKAAAEWYRMFRAMDRDRMNEARDNAMSKTECHKLRREFHDMGRARDRLRRELEEQREKMFTKTASLADECELLRELLHEMTVMRDTAVAQRDELQKKVEVLETLADEAGRGGELFADWALRERDKLQRQLDAVLEDPISVCEKCAPAARLAEAREILDRCRMGEMWSTTEEDMDKLAAALRGKEGE